MYVVRGVRRVVEASAGEDVWVSARRRAPLLDAPELDGDVVVVIVVPARLRAVFGGDVHAHLDVVGASQGIVFVVGGVVGAAKDVVFELRRAAGVAEGEIQGVPGVETRGEIRRVGRVVRAVVLVAATTHHRGRVAAAETRAEAAKRVVGNGPRHHALVPGAVQELRQGDGEHILERQGRVGGGVRVRGVRVGGGCGRRRLGRRVGAGVAHGDGREWRGFARERRDMKSTIKSTGTRPRVSQRPSHSHARRRRGRRVRRWNPPSDRGPSARGDARGEARGGARAREGARGGSVGVREAREGNGRGPRDAPDPRAPVARARRVRERRAMVDVRRRVRARNLRGRPVALHLHLEHRPEDARPDRATRRAASTQDRCRRDDDDEVVVRRARQARVARRRHARLRARELARRAADAAAAPPRKPRAPAPDEESLPWPPPRRAPPSNPPLPARRRPEPSRNHRSRNDAENTDPAGVRTRPRAFNDGIDVDRRPGTSRLARTVAASARRASAAAATGVPKTIAEARCETCGARNVCAAVDATRPFQRGAAPPARERIGEGARRKTVTRTATPAAKTLAPCARSADARGARETRIEPTTRASHSQYFTARHADMSRVSLDRAGTAARRARRRIGRRTDARARGRREGTGPRDASRRRVYAANAKVRTPVCDS